MDSPARREAGTRAPTRTSATALYRSVGVTATALATGAANSLTISGSTATFASALANNIGVGDVIQYGGRLHQQHNDSLAFIHGRTSSQVFTVKSKTGAAPTAVVGDNNWSIAAHARIRGHGDDQDGLGSAPGLRIPTCPSCPAPLPSRCETPADARAAGPG